MSATTPVATYHCETLAVVGVGLMGAAIAIHARRTGAARRVIGIGRSEERLTGAVKAGILDGFSTSPSGVRGTDIAVICTPVDRIVEDVRKIAAVLDGPKLMTDAGSVKAAICNPLAGERRFVGSHPLAGSDRQGFEYGHEVKLDGRLCVVTPTEATPAETTDGIVRFWQTLGMIVSALEPDAHDLVLARTSHFPHAAAYALAAALQHGDERFAASGFRDTTRIAGSDPELWTAILMNNVDAVRATLAHHSQTLTELDTLLARGDRNGVRDWLTQGKRMRDSLPPA
jgi:prephenate dehydrogenase